MKGDQDDRGGDRRDREERQPFPDHILIPAPAAGQPISFHLDATWNWRIVSLVSALSTSAAAPVRYLELRVKDPEGNVWAVQPASQGVAAHGVGIKVSFGRFSAFGGDEPTLSTAGMTPEILIPGGWTLELGAFNLDAGDQFGAARVFVEKQLS